MILIIKSIKYHRLFSAALNNIKTLFTEAYLTSFDKNFSITKPIYSKQAFFVFYENEVT